MLDGSCSYVLDRMHAGLRRAAAVAEAQARGLAEADPSLDLSGRDAVHKLALLATAAFGEAVAPDAIACEGLDAVTHRRVAAGG